MAESPSLLFLRGPKDVGDEALRGAFESRNMDVISQAGNWLGRCVGMAVECWWLALPCEAMKRSLGNMELLDVEGPAVRRPSDVDVVKRHFDVWDPESCQASWMVRL